MEIYHFHFVLKRLKDTKKYLYTELLKDIYLHHNFFTLEDRSLLSSER